MIPKSTVTLNDIKEAEQRIRPYINKTKIYNIAPNLYLKAEHEQIMKSFKIRGATNALLQLPDDAKKRGVITRSSGNFAQALSYIARELKVNATIVMPESAPKVKVENTKALESRVILKGTQHLESQAVVDELSEVEGLSKMHPFDHPHVIAGQGTAMLEICDELEHVDVFICPISGGGLMAGCATALKAIHPDSMVIAVEPEGANDYFLSRKQGEAVELKSCHSIADGLLAPAVGKDCRPLLDTNVDDVITLSEDEIRSAMADLHDMGQKVEPSGSASYAGYKKVKDSIENKVCVIMASGGNYDPT